MRKTSPRRTILAGLLTGALSLPGPALAGMGQMLQYLTTASDEAAAEYLAGLIQAFGCEVRTEDREAFSETFLAFLAFDFGLDVAGYDRAGLSLETHDVRRGLYAFGHRAGPVLIDRGALEIDADGTARLTSCNMLIS